MYDKLKNNEKGIVSVFYEDMIRVDIDLGGI